MSENDSQYNEKRKHPRKPCLISVECGLKDSVFTNHIHNISDEGVYIETEASFSIGQEITLRILAPYTLKNVKHLIGKVVRIEVGGIAVKFIRGDAEQKDMIKEFVENI